MSRGKFISFEGGEGCGKSTQVKILRNRLLDEGIDVIVTREPGGAPGAEKIRQLLLTGEPEQWLPMTEVLLFYGARVDHLERTIRPALAAGKWVISDRYADSTFAYQGAGHGLNSAVIQEIHRISTGDFWPDMTILLDMPQEQGLARANQREAARSEDSREDRFEKMPSDYHRRLAQAFLTRAGDNPDRFRVVPADGTMEQVAALIWKHIWQQVMPHGG